MSNGLQIFDAPQEAPADGVPAEPLEECPPKRRPRWPGGLAGGIAILMVITWATGLVVSMEGLFALGVSLSLSAMLLSVISVAAGTVAVVGNWGRGWGIAAIGVGLLLNPVVVLYVLTWLGAL